MAVTIHDLARLAELNASTVSRALRGDPRVKPATRQRVAELAAKHGYSPNQPARQLARGKTGNIWFCLGTPDSDLERRPAVLLSDLFYEHGLDLQLVLHNNSPERFRQRLKKLYQRVADGVIIIPPCDTDECESLTDLVNQLPLPHLFIDRYWPGLECPIVTTDNAAAVRRLVDRCVEWGAREFCLDFYANNPVSRLRCQAAAQRIDEHRLPRFMFDQRGGRPRSAHPLGVISNSGRAIGSGELPANRPLFGGFFDYWENPTADFYDKVIICRQDFDAIARISADLLRRMLAGDSGVPAQTLVPPASYPEL